MTEAQVKALALSVSDLSPYIKTKYGKNLYNMAGAVVQTGGFYSGTSSSVTWNPSAPFTQHALIPVEPGKSYVLFPAYEVGTLTAIVSYLIGHDIAGTPINYPTQTANTTTRTRSILVPAGVYYLSFPAQNSMWNFYKGTIQLEEGLTPTAYESYGTSLVLRADKLENNTITQAAITALQGQIDTTVRKNFPKPFYKDALTKMPNFRNKMLAKTEDINVVMTGTSLFVGSLWASTRSDATTRPPLMHTNDLASAIWDKLLNIWPQQQYRRYDNAFFTLVGAGWTETATDAGWYDTSPYHNGLTKFTTAINSGVSFIVPIGAWQFNFIYRTDSVGAGCTVAITEGNAKMEAWDGSAWVEANGFTFTMLEPAATSTKGNTIYQKRLKMRCKNKAGGGINSLTTAKTVSILKGSNANRFMFVGVEWSPKEFMCTLINAAGGGQNWGTGSLPATQDSDIWVHNPDLIIAEITSINWGASAKNALANSPITYADKCKRWYFNGFSDEANSLHARSSGYTTCDVMFVNDTLTNRTDAFGPWVDSNGVIAYDTVTTAADTYTGAMNCAYDNYNEIDKYMMSVQSAYFFISLNNVFKTVAEKFYGTHYLGLAITGTTGVSLTNDGTHWNDNGAALAAAMITPVFDF